MPKPFPDVKLIHTVAIDFDGVFTDNKVWVDQEGREAVVCDRRDGLAFDMMRAAQLRFGLEVDFFILTREANPVVVARAAKLKVVCHHSVSDKLSFVRLYLAERFPGSTDLFAGLVYIGNDLNDLPVMRRAGYAVAPSDAHPKVKEIADLVLEEPGGQGVVRAFIERLLGVSNLSDAELDELVSPP